MTRLIECPTNFLPRLGSWRVIFCESRPPVLYSRNKHNHYCNTHINYPPFFPEPPQYLHTLPNSHNSRSRPRILIPALIPIDTTTISTAPQPNRGTTYKLRLPAIRGCVAQLPPNTILCFPSKKSAVHISPRLPSKKHTDRITRILWICRLLTESFMPS